MQFNKNKLINQTIDEYMLTWSHTLDTADYVDSKYLKKIDKYIYDDFKKKLKEVEIYNLLYLQQNGFKIGLFKKIKIMMSGLKPLYINELKAEQKASHKRRKTISMNDHSPSSDTDCSH